MMSESITKQIDVAASSTLRMCILTRQDHIREVYRNDPARWVVEQRWLWHLAKELNMRISLNPAVPPPDVVKR